MAEQQKKENGAAVQAAGEAAATPVGSQEQQEQSGDEQAVVANGEQADGAQEQEQEPLPQVPQVTIRLPSPTHPRTLPKTSQPLTTLALLPQPQETIQELKLAINDWIGGYWLGPYSLRIPAVKPSDKTGSGSDAAVLSKGKDGAEVRAGEKLSDWMEVGDVFAWAEEGDERVLEVVREPYSDFSARQTVLRLIDLIMPVGTTANHLATPLALSPGSTIFESVQDGRISASGSSGATSAVYEEVEVALPSGRKGKAGKKEVIKVKREVATDASNPFADWRADVASGSGSSSSSAVDLGKLPMAQEALEALPCVRSIQLSPFNPPQPHLRQQAGHQLYLQVSLLEGEIFTLVCTSRGWYVSKSNVNHFDPAPRGSDAPQYTHSLIDLLHSLSPQFSDRLAQLAPLTTQPPALEPISTVPIPQAEPAYPWLATVPKQATTADILRTQLAYLHTGATTADALDSARDWNEEIQGIKELPKEGMQEQVLREKMAQKTWAEYTAACVRAVVTVSRGDIPPLNPNEDPRGHMWLLSNLFITRGIDCLDTYAHLGGDAAAYVSHSKDAAGVKLLNKLDVEGVHLLGHTVVDWLGERWICQSMLPGIFNRRKDEAEAEVEASEAVETSASADGEKKEDWVEVGNSPTKSASSKAAVVEETSAAVASGDAADEPQENPLIIYGMDSEHLTSVHWDAATHKVMEKIGQAYRLAAHKVTDGQGAEHEFYASAEVKALRGTDGRRYLLDLPRLSPVDVEWLEKDMGGEMAGPAGAAAVKEGEAKYPHRVVLLRPELVETFWESELKRWAREAAAKQAEDAKAKAGDKPADAEAQENGSEEKGVKADGEVATADGAAAPESAAAQPIDTALLAQQLEQFELRFNPDAFVDHPVPRDQEDKTQFVPSKITDESDPAIKAVREASVFLRSVAIPALVVDVLTGQASGIMDGQSLSKTMHQRGINMRYLGYLAQVVAKFSDNQEGGKLGYLSSFKTVVQQEMLVRAGKHVLRRYINGLQPEHVSCAIAHFLNCLLGTAFNASPKASYDAFDLGATPREPAYTALTPDSLRKEIVNEVQTRFRWTLADSYFEQDVRKPQVLRELATRVAFQLVQRRYVFDKDASVNVEGGSSEEDKSAAAGGKKRKGLASAAAAKPAAAPRTHTFEPSDVLTCLPVVKSTAPSVSVAEQIFEAGRATINRGKMDMGLEFMLEAINMYENIHSVIHPEVAAAYNQYASTLHQLARLKIQQFSADAAAAGSADPEQPLGLDIATALRLQRQAVIIAERTLGVWHSETLGYYLLLAMLENLDGNAAASLRYFRHVLSMWDVIYGEGHPEINTVLTNAGVVLQSMNENGLSLNLLNQVDAQTTAVFGPSSIQKGQALHSLTQALFLAGDIPKALEVSSAALDIFKQRFGEDHPQTAEVGKNVELLRAVVENVERQKQATQQAKDRQAERLKAVQARVATSTIRQRLGAAGVAPATAAAAATAAANGSPVPTEAVTGAAPPSDAAPASRIGEKGDLSVDELVKFIQGQNGANGQQAPKRGAKNALRGKRRTGAKR